MHIKIRSRQQASTEQTIRRTAPARYAHGVIIGRFNPPHRGHCFLIDVARQHSRQVTVFLCSMPSERIPGALRVQWLRELFPALRVVHIATADSAAARGGPQAIGIWAATMRARLSQPADVLFASEDYGDELAAALGIDFVNVDNRRKRIPISGQELRAAPLHYWRYLPPVARPYFLLLIVLSADQIETERRYAAALADYLHTVVLDCADGAALHIRMQLAHTCAFVCAHAVGGDRALPDTYYPPLTINLMDPHARRQPSPLPIARIKRIIRRYISDK